MRFFRQFMRENPVLIAIYGVATCYALVYLSISTVFPQKRTYVLNEDTVLSPQMTQEPAAEIVDVIKSIVATQQDLQKAREFVNVTTVQHDVDNNDRLVEPSLLRDITRYLSDYSHEISIPFRKSYLNPCWKESLTDTNNLYGNNAFIAKQEESSLISKILQTLAIQTYRPRLKSGEHWRFRCLPYFYIIGMAKCGTTDVWDKITMHPQVHAGLKKEYHWWSRARIDLNSSIQEYISMFDVAAEKIRTSCPKTGTQGPVHNRCVTGESTVSTFWHCKKFDKNMEGLRVPPDPYQMTPGLLHRLQPNAKLILILRDPVTRLYSDYVFFSTGKSRLSARDFHTRCEKAIEIMQNCFQTYDLRTCVHSADLHKELPIEIFKSIYIVFLLDWLTVFPRQQLLILHMETYSQNRAETLDIVFQFLDLDAMEPNLRQTVSSKPISNSAKKHYSTQTGPMLQETRAMLNAFFKPFNDQLAQLIGDNRYKWI